MEFQNTKFQAYICRIYEAKVLEMNRMRRPKTYFLSENRMGKMKITRDAQKIFFDNYSSQY